MKPPAANPFSHSINGLQLGEAFGVAALLLDRHAEAINALNVFPVPDGDTGTNMALTLRAAADGAGAAPSDSIGATAAAIARGAIMGARGNSGVILAQMLRGTARALEGHHEVGSVALADAMRAGADAGYAAVASPIEGTILTVAREAAVEAQSAARAGC